MKNNTVIVDLQGFKDNENRFIVKELSIATREYTHVFLIKPPYPFSALTDKEKENVRWLERNRGYRWSEGYIDFREFKRIIVPYFKNQNIIVKGAEKVKWLQELCDHKKIQDITDQGIPNFKILFNLYCKDDSYNCLFHKKICAIKNVLCIKKWCLENKVFM